MPLSDFSTSSFREGPSLGVNAGGGGIFDAIQTYRGMKQQNQALARQQRMQDFLEKTGPALVTQLHDASDAPSVLKVRDQLHSEALKAGFDPSHIAELDKAIIEPSIANLGADQLAEIGRQLQPQTTITEKPVNLPAIKGPFGPGLEQANMTAPELTTTPGRSFSQGDALKLAEIQARTGVKAPQGLSSLIGTPSAVDERQAQAEAANQLASRRKVQRQLEEQQIETLEGLPEGEIGDTGVTTRQLGMATKGSGLTGYINESRKEAAQAPVRESQVTLNAARTNQANAQADRARQLAKQVGGSAKVGTLYNEYSRLFGDPANDPDGTKAGNDKFLTWAERRSAATRKPDILQSLMNQGGRGGTGGSASPARSKPGQRQGPSTAASVLEKYGVK